MLQRFLLLYFSFFASSFSIYSQTEDLYNAYTIPLELIDKSNAVVRYDAIHIDIKAYDKMIYKNKRIITVLNEEGDRKIGAYQYYDSNKNIKKLEAKIFNTEGEEIKKVKEKDFLDVSAVSGGTLYSDNRVKYLRYTPINYPYTVLFEVEVEYNSTAFLPGWRPIEGFYTSTQNATYKITNTSDVELKLKTLNFESFNIEKQNNYSYRASNLKSILPEDYSPAFKTYAPLLKAALVDFSMEGVRGVNSNWQDFGKWMNEKLIAGTRTLPQEVKDEIMVLTASATTDIEKAKLIYQYMQNKTRYISVQVGIGGWKPMPAEDVDRLGYGDCKALTNYTKALLDEVDVESYYTVIYGGRNIRNIDKDFSATEGNHVILSIPNNDDYIWLECTSQSSPFGFNANFTDDRDALIITPQGGKIVHTKVYHAEDNLKETKAEISLEDSGEIMADVNIMSHGTRYSYHSNIISELEKDQKLHYKEYWSHINALEIHQLAFNNNKDDITFEEQLALKATHYASKAGNRILLKPNAFNVLKYVPSRYKKRTLPFEIERGLMDKDTYEIALPKTLQVEALQDAISIHTKFGIYEASIVKKDDSTLIYTRVFKLNKGKFNKEDYNEFRNFMLQIKRYDNSKIVLKKV